MRFYDFQNWYFRNVSGRVGTRPLQSTLLRDFVGDGFSAKTATLLSLRDISPVRGISQTSLYTNVSVYSFFSWQHYSSETPFWKEENLCIKVKLNIWVNEINIINLKILIKFQENIDNNEFFVYNHKVRTLKKCIFRVKTKI